MLAKVIGFVHLRMRRSWKIVDESTVGWCGVIAPQRLN